MVVAVEGVVVEVVVVVIVVVVVVIVVVVVVAVAAAVAGVVVVDVVVSPLLDLSCALERSLTSDRSSSSMKMSQVGLHQATSV